MTLLLQVMNGFGMARPGCGTMGFMLLCFFSMLWLMRFGFFFCSIQQGYIWQHSRFTVDDPVCGLVVTGSIWTTPEGHWWHGVDPWERMAVYHARDAAHRAFAIPALIAAYAFPAGVRECIVEFTLGT